MTFYLATGSASIMNEQKPMREVLLPARAGNTLIAVCGSILVV